MAGKEHRKRKAGKKAEKQNSKKLKKQGISKEEARKQNPRAFAFQSAGAAKASRARSAEKEQRRLHAPLLERDVEEAPPFVVLVQGPPGVGKSTLIKCLVKHYTRQNLGQVLGPITVVAGKKRRITFVECPSDLCGMMDAAKYADLVLLLIDGSFGFEMETFEFLNLLQVHGFPKVMGVLTHLDGFREPSALKKTKKKLKARFWAEIYDGAKLFYLSGIQHGKYLKREVLNLARFISVTKQRPLTWRLAHPYVLTDRFEDITPRETVRANPKADREVVLYGFLRGAPLKADARVHVAGVGDFTVQELDGLPDPCPLPSTVKRRGLVEKERLLYAPMADVGGVLYDKDAVYVDIPDWKVQYSKTGGVAKGLDDGSAPPVDEGEAMVRGLQAVDRPIDQALAASSIRLFQGGKAVRGTDTADSDDGDDDDDDMDGDEDDDDGDDGGGSDWSDDGEEEEEPSGKALRRGMPSSAAVRASDGRVRRAAVFGSGGPQGAVAVEPTSGDGADSEFDDDDDDEDEDGDDDGADEEGGGDEADEEDDEEEAMEEEEGLGAAGRWKHAMAQHAAAIFASRSADLASLVYSRRAVAGGSDDDDEDSDDGAAGNGHINGFGAHHDDADQDGEELAERRKRSREASGSGSDDSDDDFFTLKRPGADGANSGGGGGAGRRGARGSRGSGRRQRRGGVEAVDALDSSRVPMAAEVLSAWEDAELVQSLRNRFVTGDWSEGAKRASTRPGASDDEEEDSEGGGGGGDDEVFGDFEDMETGEQFNAAGGKEDAVTAAAQRAIAEARAEELRAAKAAKKAMFDETYETKGAKGIGAGGDPEDEEEAGGGGGKGKPGRPGPKDEETYYDAVKREMAERQAETRTLLNSLPASQRMAMEGLRPGVYVRMRFTGVPCELVAHHDPCRPLLVGGLGQGEEKLGMMKVRFKRHRWFPKLLKNRDPLVFSIGWRRFQALPTYSVEDHNRRLRLLKYTPEHMHCVAVVWGPLAPPNSGVVAVQRLGDKLVNWRISATGVVTELDAEVRVVKKLKLVGTPFKIHRHTAFIGGMFNSALEVSKFEGASIRTVSGIRGTIKKALRPGVEGAKDGSFRATFEDKPLMSDIVFLRAWVAVPLPRFYNPVTNLLAPPPPPPADIRAPKQRKGARDSSTADQQAGDEQQPAAANGASKLRELFVAGAPAAASAINAPSAAVAGGAAAGNDSFMRAVRFEGARPGYVFRTGPQGLGYYKDFGSAGNVAAAKAAARAAAAGGATTTSAAPAAAAGAGADAGGVASADVPGVVVMRTVAQLRRELNTGAPRESDSLYKQIERAPRKFNPLKVPKALQAALPFKTKPKLEPARKRKTLEQKRAVVLERDEKKAATLLQQLNAIRNDKAAKRREQGARKRAEYAKKQATQEEWRTKLQKEERKKRYREVAAAEKRKVLGQKRARKD